MKLRAVFALTVVALMLVLAVGCSHEQINNPAVAPAGDDEGTIEVRSPEENLSQLNKSIDEILPGHYIVQFANSVADVQGRIVELENTYGITVTTFYEHAIKGFPVRTTEEVAASLIQEPDIVAVELDRKVQVAAQTIPTGVDRMDTELNPIAAIDGQPGVVDVDIAILDTGLDFNSNQLNVVDGMKILDGVFSPDFMDDNGHGTHVAGIAAAVDDTVSVVGVAPGARLWAVKVLDATGFGRVSDVIFGLDWVMARAADIEIANLSFSGVGYSSTFRAAVANCVGAGIVVVTAAGNDAGDVYGADGVLGTADDIVPAAFPEVATISAYGDSDGLPLGKGHATSDGPDDSFASFSNYSGSVDAANPVTSTGLAIDLTMPGVDIVSLIPGGHTFAASGTSTAAPHAAGLYALYIAEHGRPTSAAGVYSLRQAVIDAAVPQDHVLGLANGNDPDGNPERLGFASLDRLIGDIAVTNFSGPASVLPGDTMVLSVTLTNNGPSDVTTPFNAWIYIEENGFELVRKTVPGLGDGVGVSRQINFTVPAKVLSKLAAGTYTIVCTNDHYDIYPENNSASIDVVLLASADLGSVFIDATPDTIGASWTLLTPQSYTLSGYGDYSFADMEPGDYTLTWNDVPGWRAPDPQTLTLVGGSIITFEGVFIPAPGALIIDAEPDILNAPWEINGPDEYYVSANGDTTISELPEGDYTVTWGEVAGYKTPSPETQFIGSGSVITYFGEYTKLPGIVHIDAAPDSINAPWTLAGPDSLEITGTGDQTLNNMTPGKYTIIWNLVTGYDLPNPAQEALILAAGEEITFTGTYKLSVGSVFVDPNPNDINAPWTLSLSNGTEVTGTGDQLLNDIVAGTVTVTWGEVSGYTTPDPQTLVLATGASITFTATYFPETNEAIGLYFDTGATQTCTDAAFLAHIPAYIIYTDPSIAETRGFECGIQLTGAANTSVSVTYPLQATDVGTFDSENYIFNYIAGYADPMPTTSATVMATMDIFFLDMVTVTMNMLPANPSSSANGLPMVMLEDFSLLDVQIATPEDILATAGECDGASFDGVRNLYK